VGETACQIERKDAPTTPPHAQEQSWPGKFLQYELQLMLSFGKESCVPRLQFASPCLLRHQAFFALRIAQICWSTHMDLGVREICTEN
jgi:hypothetical protein